MKNIFLNCLFLYFRYCDTVSNLIDKGDDKWKNVWKAGVLELFQNPEYSVNSINSLLKVIERAFKVILLILFFIMEIVSYRLA